MKSFSSLLVSFLALGCLGGCKPDKPVVTPPLINQPGGGGGTSMDVAKGTLDEWKKGNLDIHFINTGRGECAFMIFPDGTQMVLDCGASVMKYDSGENLGYPQVGIYPQPSDAQVAGWAVSQYIAKCMKWTGNNKIDYGLNTHFDGDHLGVGYEGYGVTPPKSAHGSWYLTGFTYLMEEFGFGTMIDHGYPSYNYPYAQSGTVKTNCDNYRKAADYYGGKGMKREIFKAGSADQIKMLYSASEYPQFKVQNIFVNGEIWTGKGTATRQLFPAQSTFVGGGAAKEASPSENSCSAIVKISYGQFDYYGGGDAGFNGASNFAWKHVEGNVAPLVGQVEVMKATHHSSADGCSKELLDGLKPSDIIINVWQAVQPRNTTYNDRLSKCGARLYATNINKAYMAAEYNDKGSKLEATTGHIVVRVAPGGSEYVIYQLDSSDPLFNMKILKTFGPYKCK